MSMNSNELMKKANNNILVLSLVEKKLLCAKNIFQRDTERAFQRFRVIIIFVKLSPVWSKARIKTSLQSQTKNLRPLMATSGRESEKK